MARSHGSSGGGSHRSGSSSRSFGGSSSSRSHSSGSSSRSHSSHSSSYSSSSYRYGGSSRNNHRSYGSSSHYSYGGGGYYGRNSHNNYYGGNNRGPSTHVTYNAGRRSNGGSSVFVTIILILIVLFIFKNAIFSSKPNSSYEDYRPTVTRNKYTGATDSSHGYYKDDTTPVNGEVWIDSTNEHYINSGFQSFYNDTGIYPFLYLVDDTPANTTPRDYSHEIYQSLFGDCPGNFLILYLSDDDEYYMEAGSGTGGILDSDAQNLIEAILEDNWEESDLAQLFGESLETAGQTLMTPAQQQALANKNAKLIIMTIGGVIVLAVAGAFGYKFYKKKKQADKEADERLEKILSTPLETFDQADMDRKYGSGTPVASGAPTQTPYGTPATSGAPAANPFESYTTYGRYKDYTPGSPTPGLTPTNRPNGTGNQPSGNDPSDSIIPGATLNDGDDY